MLVTSLGFCLRVIVNETHINLEKTTSTVPSVIFINLWVKPKTTGCDTSKSTLSLKLMRLIITYYKQAESMHVAL